MQIPQVMFTAVMVIFVAIVPGVVRLKQVPLDDNLLFFWTGLNSVDDYYSYYKSRLVIIAGVFALISWGWVIFKAEIALKWYRLYIPLSFFVLLLLVSTITSDYPRVAWLGGPDRGEGALVWLAYLIICLASISIVKSRGQVRTIAAALLVSAGLLGILGISQFYGFRLISSRLGEYLIIPAGLRHTVDLSHSGRAVCATLYNPNFAGMYFSMVFTFAVVCFIKLTRPRQQMLIGALCCILFASLLGTSARGAWIGAAISLTMALWLLRGTLLRKRLPTVLLTLCLLAVYIIMNQSTQGSLNTRMGSIKNSISHPPTGNPLWIPRAAQPGVIHAEYQSIKIWLDKNQLTLQAEGKQPLKLCINNGGLIFYDNWKRLMTLPMDREKTWYLSDDKYGDYSMQLSGDGLFIKVGELALPAIWIIDQNKLWFRANLTARVTGITGTGNILGLQNASNENLSIKMEKGRPVCVDSQGQILPLQQIPGRTCYFIADSHFVDYLLVQKDNILLIDKGGRRIRFVFTDQGVFNLDLFGRKIPVKRADSIGFQGRETLFSSRGYIWSRTVPLLKDTLWLGHGPDTFFFYFPQSDRIGKYLYLDSAEAVVDKPHNLYLQTWMNTGLLSLLALLALFGYYIITSLRLYCFTPQDNIYSSVGMACLTAITAYLICGLVYDSCICVAPVFWCLLGLGAACNHWLEQSMNDEIL